ncbi:MAG: FAD-dependent oxidoreductase [Acidobacteriia bacterium]|nr:FAD-dependent oxidoreductase [Terriglobia bacterium]
MDRGTVFVVGAGPAGLFAARKIASAGYQVVIFNRDVKPGGLAEYGIYPEKHHMKQGLRKQFTKILEMPNVTYFGNAPVRETGVLRVGDLRQWNPLALVFAVGAQGTKKLGMPGEDARGVYSAKDYVFYYNQLPPFASQDFSSGRRVAIVGMGNVMVDIARWLLVDMPGEKPEEVTVVARRGPFEVKFDEKEFDHIEMFLDRQVFQEELRRVDERIRACNQDISQVPEKIFPWLNKPATAPGNRRLSFRFLTSPVAIEPDANGRISKLKVVENNLVLEGDTTKAKATDKTTLLDFDTLIFAIGDVADPTVGIPYAKGGYVTNPDTVEPDRAAYEVFDAQAGKVLEGHYVVGWARKASEGLVGKARFDAEHGVDFVLKYLESAAKKLSATPEQIARELARHTDSLVAKQDVALLTLAEEAKARAANRPAFKFSTNQEMLAAIQKEKEGSRAIPKAAA